MCLVRLPDSEKALPQMSQRCGFSPVFVRMCLVTSLDVEEAMLHASQRCGFVAKALLHA